MDANLVFWCLALLDLGAVAICTAVGVRRARAGNLAAHRRSMLAAVTLVGVFLVSYLAKLAVLGREDRSAWTFWDFTVLYVHESFVAMMLLGGGIALWWARGFRERLGEDGRLPEDGLPLPGGERHRWMGRVAFLGVWMAFITAMGVLAGMFSRAG